jgi:hypothetical protein
MNAVTNPLITTIAPTGNLGVLALGLLLIGRNFELGLIFLAQYGYGTKPNSAKPFIYETHHAAKRDAHPYDYC